MRHVSRLFLLCIGHLSLCAVLTQCGVSPQTNAPFAKAFQGLSKPKVTSGNSSTVQAPHTPTELYDEDMIAWADEDPDAPMPGLDELWEKPPQDEWFLSYKKAMRESRKQGKPVLLWFTDSKNNAASSALDNELFATEKFRTWANEKLILLRIDQNVQDSDAHRLTLKREYVKKIRKRFKALGSPVVVILSPRGTKHATYRGYKSGDSTFYLGKLKSGYRNAQVDYGQWREEYEAKGYRVWHDHQNRKVFAKPKALKDGILYLVEPDGRRSKTSLQKLSPEDRKWVTQKLHQHKKTHSLSH